MDSIKKLNQSLTWCFWVVLATATLGSLALAATGDFDNDGDVDRDDITILLTEIRSPGPHDLTFDLNGDGSVNRADARTLLDLCTRPRCGVGNGDPNDVDDDGDGFTENQGDCDDTNVGINPDAVDVPGNGVDENCDGQDAEPDPNDVDDDGDGFTENQGDCNDANAAINPGAVDIPGNDIDENCDGQDAEPNPNDVDEDGDGFTENQGDCDDTNAAINPGAVDIPGNDIDENCDGQDAEPDPNDADDDNDGFTENEGDCDDGNANINPDAIDIPDNGIDENCDGADEKAPQISITDPLDGALVNTSPIDVSGTIDDPNATIDVNGIPATLSSNTFTASGIVLQEGLNEVVATATDQADIQSQDSIQVRLLTPPAVLITQPSNLSVINQNAIDVSGTVDDPAATVVVNGTSATNNGESFTAAQVPIREGNNVITAVATNQAGTAGTATIQVTRDTQPPMITIDSPVDGFVTSSSTITVTGMINDIVVGSVNGQQAQVTVNGISAQVANRSFVATGVPLIQGSNSIVAVGRDQGGNVADAQITVERQALTGQSTIALLSGDGQSGAVGGTLPQPLAVALKDANGNAVAGEMVIFKVVENNGKLSGPAGSVGEGRSVAVPTDGQGNAQAFWTLGTRAGAGNQRVEASAVGFVGTINFTAVAQTNIADKINIDAGNNQTGVVGQPVPRPFVAIVTDAGHNRLANVPVTFAVREGGGHFNGQSNITISTDSDGRALAVLCLGPKEGIDNNVVEANFLGNTGFPTTFVASGKPAGDPIETKISGVVLDNTDIPIEGVTVRVKDSNLVTQTGPQGQFVLQPAPVGKIQLLVDGSTAQRPGTWPNLEFDLVTIAGQDNAVGMPIYLLPLDIPNGLFVDENTGGTLTLSDLPGFSLEIAPGSATFPDGSKSGTVSVTVVHNDKVPMTPNFGQQPRFIITIQPSGVHFDPPAPMTIPNLDGLAPGEVTELYSFDHDQGQFVSIGTGTVSENGTVIASDPGVGIIKGGWHCGGNPQQVGSSGSLRVEFEKPERIEKGGEFDLIATGAPPQDAKYIDWRSDDPNIVSFETTPECLNMPVCTAKLLARNSGKTKVHVTFFCTTTIQSVSTTIDITVPIEFRINVSTFIPYEVGEPTIPIIVPRPPFPSAGEFTARGDGFRSFDPDAESFRTRQTVTVVTDNDPIIVDGPVNIASPSRMVLIEPITRSLIDIVSFQNTNRDMFVTARRVDNDTIEVNMRGTAGTRLFSILGDIFGLGQIVAIDWCYNIRIDNPEGGTPTARIVGGNDNYPQYEVFINDKLIHDSTRPPNDLKRLVGDCLDIFVDRPPIQVPAE